MRLGLLWFGLWRNGESYYVPEWVKTDKQVFVQLMFCLRKYDPAHTVLMVQVENELGLMDCERDHCEAALAAWQEEIPAEARETLQVDGC